jgi:hypothetical protein
MKIDNEGVQIGPARPQKIIISLTAFIVVALGAFVLWKMNDYFLWVGTNSLTVSAGDPLTTDRVKIEFGVSVNTINRLSDAELFADREKYTILYDGKFKNIMADDYGENDYLLSYDDQYYLSFRHFKTNRRNQHDYYFHLFSKNDAVFVRVEIKGKNPMRFERPMLDIALAGSTMAQFPEPLKIKNDSGP